MRTLVIVAALAFAGCTDSAITEQAKRADEANGCPATATATWESFRIDASAHGADCASAQADISIRNAEGESLWAEIYPSDQVMALAGAESVEDMQRRLNEWISPPGAARNSTGDLPAWEANATHPISGEFPFYVEEAIDRERYDTLRGADAPMFCYVQGMESEACLALENGRLNKIGVQSFPG